MSMTTIATPEKIKKEDFFSMKRTREQSSGIFEIVMNPMERKKKIQYITDLYGWHVFYRVIPVFMKVSFFLL